MDDLYPKLLLVDGFDDGIIGVDTHNLRVVYSKQKMVQILVQRDGMDEYQAWEWLEFNTFDVYMGDGTPIFVQDMNIHDIKEWFEV